MKLVIILLFFYFPLQLLHAQGVGKYEFHLAGSYLNFGIEEVQDNKLISRNYFIVGGGIKKYLYPRIPIGIDYNVIFIKESGKRELYLFNLFNAFSEYRLLNFDKFNWHVTGGVAFSDIRFSGANKLERGFNMYLLIGSEMNIYLNEKVQLSFSVRKNRSVLNVDNRGWPPILLAGVVFNKIN